MALSTDAQGQVIGTEQNFTAIPYYAWANRGRGQMMVWIPSSQSSARPTAFPTVATTAKVTVSGDSRTNPRHINDGEDPASSDDASANFDWWPKKDSTEWVEMAFEKPATVSEAELYWFDDTGDGGVRVPAAWRILYRDSDHWKPVENASAYAVERNKYNKVTFRAVNTSALRLEVTQQKDFSGGIQEWKVK
jgi:hypothetical protein